MTDRHALIDIGANLAHDSFENDLDDVLARACDAGVTRIVVTGSSDASNRAAARLARRYPGVLYATAGVHPHHASDYSDESDAAIRALASGGDVVAIGECGLDYFRNFSPANAQRTAFAAQLEIAADCGLPVFLHQRDAHADFLKTMEQYAPRIARGVAHCFTGSAEMLRDYLALGLYVGITGWICDERRGSHLRDFIAEIPLDRLMIETDSPYLLPRSLRPKPQGRRNEPAFLAEVLNVVAEALGLPESEVAAATTRTAERFFALPGTAS